MELQCWKCGSPLKGIILPFSKYEECSVCNADQHACRMCREYDNSVANSCQEERADFVLEKDKANFCDFFKPRPNAYQRKDEAAALATRAKLAALFGKNSADETPAGSTKTTAQTEAERALAELKRLFGDE